SPQWISAKAPYIGLGPQKSHVQSNQYFTRFSERDGLKNSNAHPRDFIRMNSGVAYPQADGSVLIKGLRRVRDLTVVGQVFRSGNEREMGNVQLLIQPDGHHEVINAP